MDPFAPLPPGSPTLEEFHQNPFTAWARAWLALDGIDAPAPGPASDKDTPSHADP